MLDELQQLYSFYSQYGVGFFGALYLYKSHVVYKLPKIKFYFQAAGTIPANKTDSCSLLKIDLQNNSSFILSFLLKLK